MPHQPVDHKIAIQYLLGTLPEEESARLDELSIADDDFTQLLDDVENDLVDQYVRGELTADTLENFKLRYLSSPMRREKVKVAQAFIGMIDKPAATKTYQFKPRRLSIQWGLAAAALFVFLTMGYLIFQNYSLQNEVSQAKAEQSTLQKREQELQRELDKQRSLDTEKANELASIRERLKQLQQELEGKDQRKVPLLAFNLTPQMRGVTKIQQLLLPPEVESVKFTLALETNDYPLYQATLKNPATDKILWRSNKIKANQSNGVQITLPAKLLKTKNYLLELSGISPKGVAEHASNYSFQIVRQ